MATAAHIMSSLDVPAPDDMDMHSDGGIDFGDGDGDIELDLESAPVSHKADDDVSIIDAASDAGNNGQPDFEEQDDFMVDPEDVIEEDDMYADNNDPVIVEQASADPAAVSQAPEPAPQDEDLIDYSDDEGEQPTYASMESHEEDMAEIPEEQVGAQIEEQIEEQVEEQAEEHVEEHVVEQPEDPVREGDQPQVSETATGEHVEQTEQPSQREDEEYNTNADETNDQPHSPDQPHEESTAHGDANSTDAVLLQEDHSPTKNAQGEYDQTEEQTYYDETTEQFFNEDEDEHEHVNEDGKHDEHDEHQDRYEDKSSEVRSITVNYAGNELWLFKQHDPDDSGDWLLDDISLTRSRISDVFQACRASLGDDVSTEHEIGFRFDHLHNLELYEDNTACVAVSLDKLVDLYHTLQAQDGNNAPESFYISLLFRPRFATLLSDIAKFADQGLGYSALNAAVAAGETHFTNVFSESPTEEVSDWYNEEQNDAATEGQEDSAQSEFQQEEDQTECASQRLDAGHEHDDRQQYDHEEHNSVEEIPYENQRRAEYEHEDPLVSAADDSADASFAPDEQQELSYPQDDEFVKNTTESVSEAEARRAQEQDDLVDYSDDDEQTPAETTENASVKASSPSSSTVQGEETANDADNTHPASSSNADVQESEPQETKDVDHSFEQHALESNDAATQSFQDYVYQDYEADVAEGEDSFCQANQHGNNTNEDLAEHDYETTDEQLQLNMNNESELYKDEDFADEDYSESGAFLNDDNAAEWVTAQEPETSLPEKSVLVYDDVNYVDDKEVGVAEDVAAVTSDATAAVSSSEAKNLSSQGRKRSIDEAGHGADDALEPIDTKRPKV
ncbi:hypothetical protein LEMA_P123660.1 [Plenodomus lingam JN3]|uniref:Uncharacterized protein n=1 Tax=Leptosphaeria maculans (strain JN3 / isolate v23.1.3 / race Av1-4-5-6-7-8) TaxID=985895 RepID=E4ZS34_LEPMJ|nr:hypothetical protein LEMA_P123660.1 [Plenodomus lingam JN3]CBX94214.1 hypothetical protein LEMA_P123660.1 [Plenodomus lingam JN3]